MTGNGKAEESTTKSIAEKNKVVTQEYLQQKKSKIMASGIESEELTE